MEVLIPIIFAVVVFGIIGMRIYNLHIVPAEQEKAKNETEGFIKCERGTATLIARNPSISKVIKIEEAKNYTIAHEPEKTHFGAVTVGGVTTGGTYTTGGYDYISNSTKSGFYNMVYGGNDHIFQIQLTDEQYKQAQKSKIAKYLNEENKQIYVHTPHSYTKFDDMMVSSMTDKNQILNYALSDKRGYPTREKCEEILAWLCGCDD